MKELQFSRVIECCFYFAGEYIGDVHRSSIERSNARISVYLMPDKLAKMVDAIGLARQCDWTLRGGKDHMRGVGCVEAVHDDGERLRADVSVRDPRLVSEEAHKAA